MSEKKNIGFPVINEKVAEGIKKDANDSAVAKVVKKRVDAEIDRRADILDKAIDKYNNAIKDLKKCIPDLVSYGVVENADGGETGAPIKNSAYSEKRLKEKQNLQKSIADLEIAIMKAFTENDYSKLQQLSAGSQKKTEGQEE